MAKRLGIDLGTNSIGWCLLDLDNHGDPVSIFRTGVRIFSDGRDPHSLGSLKATRREARSARRRRDRFIQRQKFLINELVRLSLMPEDKDQRHALAFKDPFPIRKKASKFRSHLLDLGFEMVQFSVYMKHCAGKEQADVIENKIKVAVPDYGNVKLLQITDKQFGAILHLGRHSKRSINNEQLALF